MIARSVRLQALARFDALQALLRTEQWQTLSRSMLAKALAGLDERGLNILLPADASWSVDGFYAALQSALADQTTTADSVLPMLWSVQYADATVNADNRYANWSSGFADGSLNDYFAGDYALDASYNAMDNFSSDAFTGWIQNYALDPSYFADDYATTQFV